MRVAYNLLSSEATRKNLLMSQGIYPFASRPVWKEKWAKMNKNRNEKRWVKGIIFSFFLNKLGRVGIKNQIKSTQIELKFLFF